MHPEARLDRSQKNNWEKDRAAEHKPDKRKHLDVLHPGVRAPLSAVRSHFSALTDSNPSLAARVKEIPSYPAAQSKAPVVERARG